jgi:peptidoglycan/xylan/chitin deacetylase (PgdA/CDA1 family)
MLKSSTVNIVFTLVLVSLMVGDIYGEVSVWWYVLAIFVYSIILAYGSAVLSAQFFVPVLSHGPISGNEIALTFDDGPITGKTEKVLDVLKGKNVSAAFFCIGHRIKENPELLKRIYQEGHVLGNHSYWHAKTFDLQTSSKIFEELKGTDAVIQSSCGVTPAFFRPPYGVTNPMVAGAIRQSNHKVVGWSVRSFDTMITDRSKLWKRVTASLKGGDIVLFHDFSDTMIDILPDFIDHAHKIGLKIVRLDTLLNENPYAN